jgi:hypothetical protein
MPSPLRRVLLGAAFLALVAAVPACDKKKPTPPDSSPPPGPTGDERPPVKPQSDSTGAAASPPILIAAGSPRTAAARANSEGNLKQIALAFHNVEATYGSGFPAGVYDASGKKLGLSWRVVILPYIEQDQLYRQFKMDEPWDSPNNKKLIEKMPKAYAVQGQDPAEGKTYYRSFTGPGTVFPPPAGGRAGQPAFGLKLPQITDGTSTTLAVVEARDPVVWTKPDELVYDAGQPVPKVGGVFGEGFTVAFCDGSTRFLPKSIDEKTLRALITATGGEVVQIP